MRHRLATERRSDDRKIEYEADESDPNSQWDRWMALKGVKYYAQAPVA